MFVEMFNRGTIIENTYMCGHFEAKCKIFNRLQSRTVHIWAIMKNQQIPCIYFILFNQQNNGKAVCYVASVQLVARWLMTCVHIVCGVHSDADITALSRGVSDIWDKIEPCGVRDILSGSRPPDARHRLYLHWTVLVEHDEHLVSPPDRVMSTTEGVFYR